MSWRTVKLKEIGEIVGGGTPSTRDPSNFGQDYEWVTPKDLSVYKERYILSGSRGLSNKGYGSSSAKLLPKGTVLISSRAPIGLTAIAAQPLTTNQGCRSFIPGPDVDSLFMYYLFVSMTQKLEQHANGSTFREISGSSLANIEVEIPSLDEQKAIAKVLGSLDDKIESNLRETSLAWRLLNAEWQSLSEDSGVRPLQEILSLHYGKSLPATSRISGRVPVYGSNGITGWHNESLVQGPAIIVGRKGSIGEVHWSFTSVYPIDTTFYVQPVNNYPLLACYFALKSAGLHSMNSDSAIPGLNRDRALHVEVPIPDSKEAILWGAGRESILHLIYAAQKENEKLIELRDVLLPELLSGRISVSRLREKVSA
jgi:type I restriction enzyme S subunit